MLLMIVKSWWPWEMSEHPQEDKGSSSSLQRSRSPNSLISIASMKRLTYCYLMCRIETLSQLEMWRHKDCRVWDVLIKTVMYEMLYRYMETHEYHIHRPCRAYIVCTWLRTTYLACLRWGAIPHVPAAAADEYGVLSGKISYNYILVPKFLG